MDTLSEIENSWGWRGISPVEIVAENKFANFIIRDGKDSFWRLCPEDLYCEVIADNVDAYNLLIKDEEFLEDWLMHAMVVEAEEKLGVLKDGYKYHMTIPGPLGGEYGGDNVKIVPTLEIIKYSGDLAFQTKDLKQGDQIQFKVIE